MKYYSDVLKKFYNSEADCLEAEKSHKAKLEEEEKHQKELNEKRKTRAKEVEDAYKTMQEAQKRYAELRTQFVKDFGSYHMTYTSKDDDWKSIFDEWFKIF